MFTITKLRLLDGAHSAIRAGEGYRGFRVWQYLAGVGGFEPRAISSLAEIKEGSQIALGQMNTSPIAEIMEQTDKRVVFRTQTSIYELTEEEEIK